MRNQNLKILAGFLWIVVFTSLLFASCKKEEEEPAEPETIIPETTKVIPDDSWQDNLVGVDSTDWTLTFNESLGQEYGLETGNILVTDKGEGLLRRITSIENEGNTVVIETTQAALTEAVEKGSFEFSDDLYYPGKSARIEYFTEGVTIVENDLRDGSEAQFTVTIEVPVTEDVSVEGELNLDPSISGKAKISGYSLDYLEFNFDIEEQLDLTTEVTVASLELEEEITLAEITFPTITVMMGPVPVVLTPVFTVKIGVNIGVSSTVTTGITQDLDITTSVLYEDDNWSTDYNIDKGFDYLPPELSNAAEAKAYVQPQLAIKVYGVVSPNVSTQLYGLLEAELGADPWWSLYAGLRGDIGVKVKVWIVTVANFSANVFDLQYLIAEASPVTEEPVALFTVEPDMGFVNTSFSFDASESYDNEDPPEVLQVRWDFNGDDTWDTDWDSDKTSEYIYTTPDEYDVKLEVKDSDENTGEASHSVTVVEESGGGSPCPGTPTVTDADGNVYNTVLIGEQCWMKENLKVGTTISGEDEMLDNGEIEKYCYDDDEANCELYGGLYQWDEMMQYVTSEGAQGICPEGWHIPTDDEWKVLEGTVDSEYGVGDPEWDQHGIRGFDAGYNLKSQNGWSWDGNGCDLYGFSALPGGGAHMGPYTFLDKGEIAFLWTSSLTSRAMGWMRSINYSRKTISLGGHDIDKGFSVRCLKND